MKPYLEQQLDGIDDIDIGLPIMREYLQARILEGLQRAGAFICLSFHGGTSLRFLYQIPRYSEDLDFALDFQPEQFDFFQYLESVRRMLSKETYTVEIQAKPKQPIVHKALIRFRGLLYEMGLSPHKDQVFAVKVEVDTNPPPHAVSEVTILKYGPVALSLKHHDRASLFAGKLQAVLNRTYTKGRDWYDLWWYLSQDDWPLPNFTYMNSGLCQGHSLLPELTEENWKPILQEHTKSVDWSLVMQDVAPFIIDIENQPDFNKDRLLDLLR
ncbi:MAG: nucleotidyl transferase AbiEii/AbiGii toxin family protein [Chloroflexota bacterium]